MAPVPPATDRQSAFLQRLQEGILLFDGAMGTEIYRRHIFTNRCFEELNCSASDKIRSIHRAYTSAGADVLTTNTFGACRPILEKYGLADRVDAINRAGVRLARSVAEESPGRDILIAGSIGPTAVVAAARGNSDPLLEQLGALAEEGINFILFETLPSRETFLAAAEAMADYSPLPFVLSGTAGDFDAERAADFAARFAPLPSSAPQPAAWGINCGLGPAETLAAAQAVISSIDRPLILQPNAGGPKEFEGRQIYYCSPEYLGEYALRYAKLGARGIGGCCGIGPEHIASVGRMLRPWRSGSIDQKVTVSAAAAAAVEQEPAPLEERSNLGKKIAAGDWIETVELTPPQGYDLTNFLDSVRRLAAAGVATVNLPDGPRASARIAPLAAAKRIIDLGCGIEPILHFCSRDRNLIGMQADLLACAALGVRNILFITGDPPKLGDYPGATGVFDASSVDLCRIQGGLNRGLDLARKAIGLPTRAVFGAGVDPTSPDPAREIEKTREKIAAGALFLITQPVFDPEALLRFLEKCGELCVPVIAGVWPFSSYKNAIFMHNEVPGVHVTDAILSRMEAASHHSIETQRKVGIEIARETIERIGSAVSGVQMTTPIGRIEIPIEVLRH
ncbi:MAG: bifunctional homocysteine S-methyltransferase/methylenetetrahydrofolate reductase [Thermoguttaceae bacterium]|nr:bifunctional homocysteine S-methyltransferase/methylenetetrahydrofolate reductase [Thermoguttaceae bacterium]